MGATMGKSGNFLDAIPTQSTLHVVMLGLDSAGKTTALYRLKFDQYLNTVPTIGFNCEKVQGTMGKARGMQFLVWDVGGQEKLRPLWRSYTRCTDGILFVVDSVDVERMEEAKMELMRTAKCPDNQGVPVLILANKQDLPGACNPKDLEKLLGLNELAQDFVITTSSVSTPKLSNISSSSTGNIVGCSNSSIASGSIKYNNTGRSLTPTNSAQNNSYSRSFGSATTTSNDIKISFNSSNSSLHDVQHHDEHYDVSKQLEKSNDDTFAAVFSEKSNKKESTVTHFKGWYIQPACAITGEGLQEGLEALYEMILRRRKLSKAHKKTKR